MRRLPLERPLLRLLYGSADVHWRLEWLAQLLTPKGVRSGRVLGTRFEGLDLSDLIQRGVYLGLYEREETRFLRRIIEPGMTVMDVGANIGYYTAVLAHLVGATGRVFAFEPDPYAYARLSAMVTANSLTQVTCFKLALSDQDGNCTLYVPPPDHGNHDPSMVAYREGMTQTVVSVSTLDEVLSTLGDPILHFVKLDVEGHEPRVLAGAQRALRAKRIHRLLCEFSDKLLRLSGSCIPCLYDLVLNYGFQDYHGAPPHKQQFNRFFCLCHEKNHLASDTPGTVTICRRLPR